MKWKTAKVSSLCDLKNGKAYNANDWAMKGLPIIRIQNLNDSSKGFNYWSGTLDKQIHVKSKDLLLAWSGTPGTSFGAHIWNGPEGVLNQHIFRIDILNGNIEKRWFQFCLNQQLNSLIHKAHGGVGLKHVTKGAVDALEIPLPPLDEQKRVAAILDAADALRAKRRQSIAQLDALIQSTFLDLFGDPVTNPMGWEVIPLGEICSLVNGRAFKPEEWESEGLPIIRIQNLNDDSKPFNYSSKKWPEKVRAKTNDILLSWSGTPGTSFGCFRWKGPEGWVNQHIFRVEVEPKIDSTFFIESVNARLLELISKAHGGVGLKHITKGKLETVELTLPPLPLQQKFAAIVESIERQKAAQRAHLAELDTLFAALQHRAFRGEL
jgi:type I restriction enzyme S subunit